MYKTSEERHYAPYCEQDSMEEMHKAVLYIHLHKKEQT